MNAPADSIRVLRAAADPTDEPVAPAALERVDERFDVHPVETVEAGVDAVRDGDVDAVVSDYRLPDGDGVAFLRTVRDVDRRLPFVLVAADGSEAVASAAIAAGVTDYVRPAEADPTGRAADSVAAAVERHRAAREFEHREHLFERIHDLANVGVFEYRFESDSGLSLTDEVYRLYGLDPDDSLTPEEAIQYYHEDDRADVEAAFEAAIEDGEPYDIEARLIGSDGEQRWVRMRGEPRLADGEVVGVYGTIRDVTERRAAHERLERENERLEEFAHVISHDVRTPLQVADARLTDAERTGDPEAFADVRDAHERIEALVDDVLALARQGLVIDDTRPVSIGDVARDAASNLDADGFALDVRADRTVEADPSRLRQLFANLLANAVDHGGPDVAVTVGRIDPMETTTRGAGGRVGFFVADDGPGIPPGERDAVFEAGYSTSADGTGFGLAIVTQVAEAHGWDVSVTESVDGGARFEVTGV